MSPGGLKVVGIFAVGTPENLNSSHAKLRQVELFIFLFVFFLKFVYFFSANRV